jgi:hypothetical protein
MKTKLEKLWDNQSAAIRNYEVHSTAYKASLAASDACYAELKVAGNDYDTAKKAMDDYKKEAGL